MYNGKIADVEQSIIKAPSKDECQRILYKRYGTSYKIDKWEKTLSPGFLGFGQKEIVQAFYHLVPEKPVEILSKKNTSSLTKEEALENIEQIRSRMDLGQTASADLLSDFMKNRDALLKKNEPALTSAQLGQIAEQLEQLKKNMEQVNRAVNEGKLSSKNVPPTIVRIEKILADNEFTPSFIKTISEKVRSEFSLEQLEDFDAVESAVVDWIGESIHIAEEPPARRPHVIVIVGPTGVGKTTTIAKMAASLIVKSKESDGPRPKVKLITTDYMRVGALSMLETYGGIMDMSVDKAESADVVKALYTRYRSGTDYIFIDTSGLSPKDYTNIAVMRSILDVPSMHADVYLAVTASTKASDLEAIIRNYEQFNFRSVIITKYDETTSYGNVLSVLAEKGKKISWITTGQEVTSCFERANPARFLMDLDGFRKDEEHIKEKFDYKPDTEEA